jgi:hypothetical protein
MKATSLVDRTGCCYPIGDTRPWKFCNAPGEKKTPDSIYCDAHWDLMHDKTYHSKSVQRANGTDQNYAR